MTSVKQGRAENEHRKSRTRNPVAEEGQTHLVLGIPELLEDTPKLTLLHAGLLASDGGNLARGTTNEDLDLLLQVRSADMGLDGVGVDVSSGTCGYRCQ
jgi:hypothetical protein